MSDIEDIRRVLAQYCFATDSGDTEAWLATFTDDIIWEGGAFGRFSGKVEARAYHAASAGSAVNFRHFTTNSIIDVEGGQARVRSYVQVFDQSGASPVLAFSGLYADVFEKSDGGWRIKGRHLLAHPKDLAGLVQRQTQTA
jgi:ketosteroid isomerase-like protein